MTTEEWVDSAIRVLDVLVAWPVFAAVMLIVFREQVGEAFRWLGRLVEKREVTATTPIGSITLKRLGKEEIVRAVKGAVSSSSSSSTRAEIAAADRIAAAARELAAQLRTGTDPTLRDLASATSVRLTFAEAIPEMTLPTPDDVTRALVVLRFSEPELLSVDYADWLSAASTLAFDPGNSPPILPSRLQFALLAEATGLAPG
ncbi:MAG TPA: hypothetical protein VFK32_05625 [Tepidiformaceae bacterium]|nr:hypothetical protein [Tepidiformaceae bacterium]